MKLGKAVLLSAMIGGGSSAGAAEETSKNEMVLYPNGSRPSAVGPSDYFTGAVRLDPLKPIAPPSQVSAGQVTFEPGARSAWHTHPLGQTLIVTSGKGWVQEWGKPKLEMRAGDVVWCPPGVKHWHGATSSTGVTHIAIQETVDGKNVDWMEKVADQDYGK